MKHHIVWRTTKVSAIEIFPAWWAISFERVGIKATTRTTRYGVKRSEPIMNEKSVGISSAIRSSFGQKGHHFSILDARAVAVL